MIYGVPKKNVGTWNIFKIEQRDKNKGEENSSEKKNKRKTT